MIRTGSSSRRADTERGAVAVEFALLLPILITLMLGIIEFGLGYNAQITISAAAREGARSMALHNNVTTAKSAVKASAPLRAPGVTDAEIAVTPAVCSAGLTNTVTVVHQYKFLTGFFGVGYQITGRAAMRCGG
ncbi:MAG: pilus assembly protein [Microbacteriaceae bacterium]|nr:pilus assembly protein [Microbacteriaceae bacterium]